MFVTVQQTITDVNLLSSNVNEEDTHPEWDDVTTYDEAEYAYVESTHTVYKSVQASNLNNDPTTDDGTWWVEYSSTNKWKAFNDTISSKTENSGTIEYEIEADNIINTVAMLGLEASEVTVTVTDALAVEVYSETKSPVDDSAIVDWYTFFTEEIDFDTEVIFNDLPAYAGYTIDIAIGDGVGTPMVGKIIAGKTLQLGETLDGTSIGIRDYSVKNIDDFGNISVTQRGYADTVDFIFVMNTSEARKVKRFLSALRATPCLFYAHAEILEYGATVYGFYTDFEPVLNAGGKTTVNLEVTGTT